MIILATGDRKWDDLETVLRVLSEFPEGSTFVHGYADGLDCCVDVVATELGHKVIRCPSHWRHNFDRWVEVYGYCPIDCKEVVGRAAGVIRNKYMLETYSPELVIGFHNDILSSRGTNDMMRRAQRAGIKNVLYTSSGEVIESPVLTTKKKKVKIKNKITLDTFFDFD